MKSNSLNRVIVITIVKDDNPGLQRTLNSLAIQNVVNFEAQILVVDGSTETDTSEVISRFHHLEVTTIHRAPQGIYNAMNEGLEFLLNNEVKDNSYIVFLNAGDFFVNTEALQLMSAHHRLSALVVGNAVMLDPRDKPNVIHPSIVFGSGHEFMHPNVFWMPHQGLSVQILVFLKIGLFNESYKIAGDYDWIFRAVKEYGIPSLIPDILVAQMIDGISNFQSYSGYRERQFMAKFYNLKVKRLPFTLVTKMFIKQWLGEHGFNLSLNKSDPSLLNTGLKSNHMHGPELLCGWCYFEFYSS
jgi:glycosyltransferase involved in cell wall biosynthesis